MALEFNAFRDLQFDEQKRRSSSTNHRLSSTVILGSANTAAAAAGDGLSERAEAVVGVTAGAPAAGFAHQRAVLGLAQKRAHNCIGRRALVRKYTTAGAITAPPLVANGILYAADLAGYLYAFTMS